MDRLKKIGLVFDSVIIILLVLVFGFFYFGAHAWGAWGDDSPGYIYTAAQLLQHKSLVAQSELVESALQYFGNEPWARLAAPTHHDIISPTGWIASRYPIGLSILLFVNAGLFQNDSAMYLVVPALAVLGVLCTYLLAIGLLPLSGYSKRGVGIIAAVSLGLTELYWSYAVSQPMRDIPALTFFLLALLLIILAGKIQSSWQQASLMLLAGMIFGYSITIRETSAILVGTILALLYYIFTTRAVFWKMLGIFMIGMIVIGSVSIWNSTMISWHKEKFKKKDITSVAITSNFDHVQSLGITNLYNNQGKYKRGVGGVNQYLSVLQEEFNFWPPFLLMAILGIVSLWKIQRRLAYVFISWFASIFILFSMWINPYARYILPLFPVVTLLAGYGSVTLLQRLQRWLQLRRVSFSMLSMIVLVSFFVDLQPLVAARTKHVTQQELVNKAITYRDLENFRQVGQVIEQDQTSKPPVVLLIGFWQAGSAEMIMANNPNIIAIRYPRKRQEQPPVDMMVGWLQQLSAHYQLYLWYDDSATSTEQQLRQHFSTEPVYQTDFSFQPQVQINRITTIQ